jgi:ABC-type branched-subunit amino acid transport system substrate-binding protein
MHTLSFLMHPSRRRLLQGGALAAMGHSAFASAPATAAEPAGRPYAIAQFMDMSAGQQDVSRDFAAGSRAAWQDVNANGGLRGRPVQHLSIDVDGSTASLAAAIRKVREAGNCLALCGTVGDATAAQAMATLRSEGLQMAHAAPWLMNSSVVVDDYTFPIFAGRQEQIAHALKSLSVMGMREAGVVYATVQDAVQYHEDLERIAAGMQLKLQTFRADGKLQGLGARMGQATPALMLFIGGTPELAQFTQGLDRQPRQRYVVALADVNLQTLTQMGLKAGTSIVAAQPVPLTSSSLAVVRAYRDANGRFFDEAPTALGLAGFIAARYAFEVLRTHEGPLNAAAVLATFQRRAETDVGGYRVVFGPQKRSGTYVTQSMLTPEGRIVG